MTITVPARRRLPARTVANVASAAALLAVALGGVAIATQEPDGASGQQALSRSSTFDARFGDPVLREIRREGLRTGEIQILPVDRPSGKPALSPVDA